MSDVRLRREASVDYLRHTPLERYEVIHFATGERKAGGRGAARCQAGLASGGRSAPVWAAFSVVGDPAVVVPLRAPTRRSWWLGLAVGVLIAIVAVAVARRRASASG
jgi:hypothetical protein